MATRGAIIELVRFEELRAGLRHHGALTRTEVEAVARPGMGLPELLTAYQDRVRRKARTAWREGPNLVYPTVETATAMEVRHTTSGGGSRIVLEFRGPRGARLTVYRAVPLNPARSEHAAMARLADRVVIRPLDDSWEQFDREVGHQEELWLGPVGSSGRADAEQEDWLVSVRGAVNNYDADRLMDLLYGPASPEFVFPPRLVQAAHAVFRAGELRVQRVQSLDCHHPWYSDWMGVRPGTTPNLRTVYFAEVGTPFGPQTVWFWGDGRPTADALERVRRHSWWRTSAAVSAGCDDHELELLEVNASSTFEWRPVSEDRQGDPHFVRGWWTRVHQNA